MSEITIDEDSVAHIFRDADGHFREDDNVNRRLLIEAASKRRNLLGIDRVGNEWYAEDLADGTQVWARVRGGRIVNGGINQKPRERLPR
jgi:hypothetical protein